MEIKVNDTQYIGYTKEEKTVLALIDAKQYTEALNALAEVIYQDTVKPEFVYYGAYCYFMCGDYARAAKWVDDALNLAPEDAGVRILLAKICMMQNRSEDALAILEVLVKNLKEALTEKQTEEVKDCAIAFLRNDVENAKKNYPTLSELVFAEEKPAMDAKAVLKALKKKIAEAKERETAEANCCETQCAKVQETPAEEKTVESAADVNPEAKAQMEQILSQQIGASEKIRLLNQVAGGFYFAGDAISARLLLETALRLDLTDYTLKNLSIVMAELGDKEVAMKLAAQMKEIDFLLLKEIR